MIINSPSDRLIIENNPNHAYFKLWRYGSISDNIYPVIKSVYYTGSAEISEYRCHSLKQKRCAFSDILLSEISVSL